MKSVKKPPPNIQDILNKFGYEAIKRAVFTYGDTIYSPLGTDLPPDLIAHEEEHEKQQEFNGGPERWWTEYLNNPLFRSNQELGAYVQQYQYAINNYSRQMRRDLFRRIVKDLSSPTYGGIMTKEEAKLKIEQGVGHAN